MKGLIYALMELEETKDVEDAKEAIRIADIYLRDNKINIDTYNITVRRIKRLVGLKDGNDG